VLNPEAFSNVQFPDIRPLTQALLLCMFAFTGFEVIAVPGAEIINPRKNLPLGILIGTGGTILIYLSIQIVAEGTFPGLANSTRPLADAANLFLGRKGGSFLSIGAICSTIGTLMGLVLVGPRILFAMAVNRQLPPLFANVHPRFRTPSASIAIFTVICILVALSSEFANLATLSAMARLVTYIGSACALLALRKQIFSKDTFRVPGGPLVAALTIVISIFLLTAATRQQWISGIAGLAIGIALYAISKQR
jgi:amino acid transporter